MVWSMTIIICNKIDLKKNVNDYKIKLLYTKKEVSNKYVWKKRTWVFDR